MTYAEFEALKARSAAAGGQDYVNPRNTAAGSLRQKDPSRHRQPQSQILRLCLGRGQRGSGADAVRRGAEIRDWGFKVSPLMVRAQVGRGAARAVPADRGAALVARLRHRRRRLQDRPARPAAALGLRHRRAALGHRAQVSGRAGDDDVCERIDIQVGRTGTLAPVARLDAGDGRRRDGRERHAPQRGLHQGPRQQRRSRSATAIDIRIGDTVVIQRAGDVIPQIVEVRAREAAEAAPCLTSSRMSVRSAARRRCARSTRRPARKIRAAAAPAS